MSISHQSCTKARFSECEDKMEQTPLGFETSIHGKILCWISSLQPKFWNGLRGTQGKLNAEGQRFLSFHLQVQIAFHVDDDYIWWPFLEAYTTLFWSSESPDISTVCHVRCAYYSYILLTYYILLIFLHIWVFPIGSVLLFLAICWRCFGGRKRMARSFSHSRTDWSLKLHIQTHHEIIHNPYGGRLDYL